MQFSITGGQSKNRDRKVGKSTFEVDETDGQWTRLEEGDNSSDKGSMVPIRGIRMDTTFDVEMESLRSKQRQNL